MGFKRCLSPLISEAILLSIVLIWASIILAAPTVTFPHTPPKPPLLQPLYWNSTSVILRVVEPGVSGLPNNSNVEVYLYNETSGSWYSLDCDYGSCFYLKQDIIMMVKLVNTTLQTGVLGCRGSYIIIDFSAKRVSLLTS